jgi:hypothetical protein
MFSVAEAEEDDEEEGLDTGEIARATDAASAVAGSFSIL